MKVTIDGKRYDSERCEALARHRRHYSHSNNYSGTTTLLCADNGVYLLMTKTNGQDLYLQDHMEVCDHPTGWLNGVELDDEEEARLVELGLIKLI